jgi:hypothetical protein
MSYVVNIRRTITQTNSHSNGSLQRQAPRKQLTTKAARKSAPATSVKKPHRYAALSAPGARDRPGLQGSFRYVCMNLGVMCGVMWYYDIMWYRVGEIAKDFKVDLDIYTYNYICAILQVLPLVQGLVISLVVISYVCISCVVKRCACIWYHSFVVVTWRDKQIMVLFW